MKRLWHWWNETYLAPRDDPLFGTFGSIMTRFEQGLITLVALAAVVALLLSSIKVFAP